MADLFPFPILKGSTPEEQISEIVDYLIQFKETLEFTLTGISMDNLSPELADKINSVDANIEKSNVKRDEEMVQVLRQNLQNTEEEGELT